MAVNVTCHPQHMVSKTVINIKQYTHNSEHSLSFAPALSVCAVAKNCGDLKHAVSVFEEIKERQLPLDSHVYGALISAFAEAMTRNVSVVHERKEQYVLLERSFQYVAEAQASNIVLEMPAWNSLVTCAGRCGELSRAFGVVEMMRKSGLSPNERTIGALLESCVQAQQQERALRLFDMAIQKVGPCDCEKVLWVSTQRSFEYLGIDLPRACLQIQDVTKQHGCKEFSYLPPLSIKFTTRLIGPFIYGRKYADGGPVLSTAH